MGGRLRGYRQWFWISLFTIKCNGDYIDCTRAQSQIYFTNKYMANQQPNKTCIEMNNMGNTLLVKIKPLL